MSTFYGWQNVPMQRGQLAFGNDAAGTAGGSIGQVLTVGVGTVTAAGSSTPVAVTDAAITATSMIVLTPGTPGGTQAGWNITSITIGSGFSVTFGSSDTTVYNWVRFG